MSDEARRETSLSAPQERRTAPVGSSDSAVSRDDWEEAVRRWMDDHVRGSPIAQVPEAWNHLNSVIGELHAKLSAVLRGEPPMNPPA